MFTKLLNYIRNLFGPKRIPWNLYVVVLDGADFATKAKVPMNEAVTFIEKHSRFKLNIEYIETAIEHTYYSSVDGQGQTVYNMLRDQIHPELLGKLPAAHSYLFLYKVFWRLPQQAGSTMGVADGILKGGKRRPYATVPVDAWWYYNSPPYYGFQSRAASILAHEIINTINCVTEVPPYNCPSMVGANSPDPYIHEGSRIKSLGDGCYAKLGTNEV